MRNCRWERQAPAWLIYGLPSWGSALVRLAAHKHIVVKVRKSHQC